MIIDRNWDAAEYYREMIASGEFEVCGMATSCDKAIRMAEHYSVDVALIDIELKGSRDGIQTAELLKDRFGIPSVFLSAYSDGEMIERAVKTDVLGYLIKPLEKGCLIPFLTIAFRSYKKSIGEIKKLEKEIKKNEELLKMEKLFRKSMEQSLKKQTDFLADANRTLSSMLENREVEKRAIEFHFSEKCRKLIIPYIELLEQDVTANKRQLVLDLLKRSLTQLISPSFKTLFKVYGSLSPQEVQITDMIRNGRTTKEIADLLNIEPTSISTYRYRIRKKLGLLKTGKNLRAYLNSNTHIQGP